MECYMVFTIADEKNMNKIWISKYVNTEKCADGVIYGVYKYHERN